MSHGKFFFLVPAILLLCCLLNAPITAQSDIPKFEVGAQLSVLRHKPTPRLTLGREYEDYELDPGLGGRFGFNLTEHISVEAEMNYFPRALPDSPPPFGFGSSLRGGSRLQGLFGVKAGSRFGKLGVFGKARAGFIRYNDLRYIDQNNQVFSAPFPSRTRFALDLGGVVEINHTTRIFTRFDAGLTSIRHTERIGVAETVPDTSSFRTISSLQGNLQFGVGIGLRF